MRAGNGAFLASLGRLFIDDRFRLGPFGAGLRGRLQQSAEQIVAALIGVCLVAHSGEDSMVRYPPKPEGTAANPRKKRNDEAGSKRTLHDLGKEINQGTEYIGKTSEEIRVASDRGAALMAICQVDQGLELAILCRFHHVNMKTRDLLRKPNGTLSSFMGKIDLGYAFGIYNDKYRENLHIMRSVRNAFAHAALPIDFTTAEILTECRRLNNGVLFPIFPEVGWRPAEEYQNYTFGRYIYVRACLNAHEQLMDNAISYIKELEKHGRLEIKIS